MVPAAATATATAAAIVTATATATSTAHQKQHYVLYYLSIVLILSIKNAFGITSMFFTLVRCSIVLLMFL
jgi:hypothetical protein